MESLQIIPLLIIMFMLIDAASVNIVKKYAPYNKVLIMEENYKPIVLRENLIISHNTNNYPSKIHAEDILIDRFLCDIQKYIKLNKEYRPEFNETLYTAELIIGVKK